MTVKSMQYVPGKAILLGEHAVLHGQPAIAASLPIGMTLTASSTTHSARRPRCRDPKLRQAVQLATAFFHMDERNISIRIRSALPAGAGLGSSAALSVALVRAIANLHAAELSQTDLLRMATEIECVFHGRSSGLDVCTVLHTGLIWYQPTTIPAMHPLAIPREFALVIGLTTERRSTSTSTTTIEAETARNAPLVERSMTELGTLATLARTAITGGDIAALGQLMNAAHSHLHSLGLATPSTNSAINTARAAGAIGAKLTGAGGGGAFIALAPEPARAPQIEAALNSAGVSTFTTYLPPLTL
ncbi:mevalonate kinase [Streptomyces sp. NBC_01264]|uniref:mevalonate kinase n=1 Tax=Streptomyces sp. NBC_01264 TaxID=2903804 RepID=UPI0022535F7A|nr:mevalonate kinase [Streptomyces sp. NBC_01264]MCX4784539.1 mevalonate kinase [Streptomyces sp. NBC_01264]